jgi:hypothetical protein
MQSMRRSVKGFKLADNGLEAIPSDASAKSARSATQHDDLIS